ncbi:MAG: hypothetical protein L6W00_19980 [Lentisphaeria bacterium]|nr:MAG: hypothetical protein L6W00_19980 [Lentisphaeria bacterium]
MIRCIRSIFRCCEPARRSPPSASATSWRSATGGAAKLAIADISNPHRPKVIGSGRLDGFGDGVWVHGNYCYAATGHHARSGPKAERFGRGHGLEIFDISNPAKPRRVGGVKFPKFYEVGNDFWMVRSDGRTAFVGDTHNGFFSD